MASATVSEEEKFVSLEIYKTLDSLPYIQPSPETNAFITKAKNDLPNWLKNGTSETTKDCVLHLLSKLQFVLQEDNLALESINQAISIRPDFSVHYSHKALLLATLGDSANAIVAALKAVEINPNRSKNWFDLGKIYENANNYEEAIKAHKKAAEIDPSFAKAHSQIATLSLAGNDPNKTEVAIHHLKKAVEADPDFVDAHFNLGQIYQNDNLVDEAIPHFQKVIQLKPQDWSAKGKLVQLYQLKGDLNSRDQVRTSILNQWRAGQIKNANRFCRDQFDMNGYHYYVYEYFTLAGQQGWGVRYNFMATKNDKVVFRYSYGSYDDTNAVAKEMQPASFKPNDDSEANRMWHLDGYFEGARHVTYGMVVGERSYDEVKSQVIGIIQGQVAAISSSVVN